MQKQLVFLASLVLQTHVGMMLGNASHVNHIAINFTSDPINGNNSTLERDITCSGNDIEIYELISSSALPDSQDQFIRLPDGREVNISTIMAIIPYTTHLQFSKVQKDVINSTFVSVRNLEDTFNSLLPTLSSHVKEQQKNDLSEIPELIMKAKDELTRLGGFSLQIHAGNMLANVTHVSHITLDHPLV